MTKLEIIRINKAIDLLEIDEYEQALNILSKISEDYNKMNNKKNKEIDEVVFVNNESLLISRYLFGKIIKINPKAKKPNFDMWAKEVDRMIEIDKRMINDIYIVIDWCQSDSFWQTNILSVKKLRKHFDSLYLKTIRPSKHDSRNILTDFMQS